MTYVLHGYNSSLATSNDAFIHPFIDSYSFIHLLQDTLAKLLRSPTALRDGSRHLRWQHNQSTEQFPWGKCAVNYYIVPSADQPKEILINLKDALMEVHGWESAQSAEKSDFSK